MALRATVILIGLHIAATIVIDPSVRYALERKSSDRLIILFKTDETRTRQNGMYSFSARKSMRSKTVRDMKLFSEREQKPVLDKLVLQGHQVTSLWSSNILIVSNWDDHTLQLLENHDVTVYADRKIQLNLPKSRKVSQEVLSSNGKRQHLNVKNETHALESLSKLAIQGFAPWGILNIQAPSLWKQGITGKNVVVGSIDSGVNYKHFTLKDNFRSDYGWFDAVNSTSMPFDDMGHGTHTVATAVGKYNIGVAPDAKWIACKVSSPDGLFYYSDLLRCMQFMACPTKANGSNEDCSKAPDVVINSWGGYGYYRPVAVMVSLWQELGIIPIFAAGNDGENGCETMGFPGSLPNVIAVGASNATNQIAYFSSQGRFASNFVKPDLVAPGVDVLSASNISSFHFEIHSGTSMATPHVSGLVALLLSKYKDLSFNDIRKILQMSSNQTAEHPGETCIPSNELKWPNNVYGYGRVQGDKAIIKAHSMK